MQPKHNDIYLHLVESNENLWTNSTQCNANVVTIMYLVIEIEEETFHTQNFSK